MLLLIKTYNYLKSLQAVWRSLWLCERSVKKRALCNSTTFVCFAKPFVAKQTLVESQYLYNSVLALEIFWSHYSPIHTGANQPWKKLLAGLFWKMTITQNLAMLQNLTFGGVSAHEIFVICFNFWRGQKRMFCLSWKKICRLDILSYINTVAQKWSFKLHSLWLTFTVWGDYFDHDQAFILSYW